MYNAQQPKIHFEGVLKTTQEYKLANLAIEISDDLNQLNKNAVERVPVSILGRIFKRLTFRKREEAKSKQESDVDTF